MNKLKNFILFEIKKRRQNTRTLYHIGPRPARPELRAGKNLWWGSTRDTGWNRWWYDQKVESGVFMSDNPVQVAVNHGRAAGNVYVYDVPEWVIRDAGGLHRFDWAKELLISKEVWEDWEQERGTPIVPKGVIRQQKFDDEVDKLTYNTDAYADADFNRRYGQDRNDRSGWKKLLNKLKVDEKSVDEVLKFYSPAEIKQLIQNIKTDYSADKYTYEKAIVNSLLYKLKSYL